MMITRASSSSVSSLFRSTCLISKTIKFIHPPPPFLNYFLIKRNIFSAIPPQQCHKLYPSSTQEPHFSLITSCSSILDCQIIHTQMIKFGNYSHGFIGDQLACCYARLGSASNALKLFEEIPHKDLVSWNSMIAVFSRRGSLEESFDIFFRMRSEEGMKPNEITLISLLPVCSNTRALDEGKFIHCCAVKSGLLSEPKVGNSLINMYGKCLSIDEAHRLFLEMPMKNLVSWNSIIAVYTQNGNAEWGTHLFKSMRRVGIDPDRATIITLLQVCADLAAEKIGKAIHGYVLFSGLNSDTPIATALINVYAKSGNLNASCEVFGDMIYPDRIAWTAMLAGYAIHGHGKEAIRFFDLMIKNGAKPDHVTFTHILSACSHSGLIEEGKEYFQVMSKVYGVEPDLDHYSCMVDLLGRSGLLEEAHELVKTMPIDPNLSVWGVLLGACGVHHNVKLGKEIAETMFKLDQTDTRNYIALCNMYSAAGLWRDASKVRALMKERGLRKDTGCSFIEHGGRVYRFVVGDRSHPESDKIYLKLDELITKMKKIGYVPNTDLVLHDVDEEMKQDMISKHSEKLAIAFGLLVTSHGMPIMVTKNLRICRDCHTAAKFISSIEKRKIIIRDSKRFHHFSNGMCSCGDYW